MAILILPLASRKLRRKARDLSWLGLMFVLLSVASVAGLVGCAAGGLFSNSPTSYAITITGTGGSVVRTATVTLIEQ